MRAYDVIVRKRDGGELSPEELRFFVGGIADGSIPDEQVAAWAMAVFLRGMTDRETAELTRAMAASGATVDLRGVPGAKVDKHSTGGVGDKTTLVLAPLLAAAGVRVAKLSGRALGFTGGTLDKLESFPGLRVELDRDQFVAQVRTVGVAVAGQTSDLVPADRRLYALRDVTGTVESLPLIAASIMSKKLAGGADAIILDVKAGSGALMKDLASALRLARLMVAIGRDLGRRTAAVVSDMSQPLGRAVGNALEVREAIETLRGGGPADLRELCLELGSRVLRLAGVAGNPREARARLEACLEDGSGLERLRRLVAAQGGDARAVDDPDRLPAAPRRTEVKAERGGRLAAVDAAAVGSAVMRLGAGRERKGDPVDPAVGVVLRKKRGEAVEAGEPLAEVHYRDEARLAAALPLLRSAFALGDGSEAPPLIHAVVDP
jgi:pyrimidine-nucleoside phosphorylase